MSNGLDNRFDNRLYRVNGALQSLKATEVHEGLNHRSRIRYLSKKIANFNEFSEIKKFVKKFVKCPSVWLPRVPGYPSGTRVIIYPCNILLPDLQRRFALYSDLLYE